MTATTTTPCWTLRVVVAGGCALAPACGGNPLPAVTDVQFDAVCGDDVNLQQWQRHPAVFLGTLQSVAPHGLSTACAPETQQVAALLQVLVEEELSGQHPELVGSVQDVVFLPGSVALGNPVLRADANGGPVWERVVDGPGEALRVGQVLGVGVGLLDGRRWLGANLFTVNEGLAFQPGSICVSGMVGPLQGASVATFSASLQAADDDVTFDPMPVDEADAHLRGRCPG